MSSLERTSSVPTPGGRQFQCLQAAHSQPQRVLIPVHSALPPRALTALAGFASRGPPLLLNRGRRNGFCKMEGKPGPGSAAVLAAAGTRGFVPTVNSWREMKKYLHSAFC